MLFISELIIQKSSVSFQLQSHTGVIDDNVACFMPFIYEVVYITSQRFLVYMICVPEMSEIFTDIERLVCVVTKWPRGTCCTCRCRYPSKGRMQCNN